MSTKEFGCFFCDGKSDNKDDNCPKCHNPINISSELLTSKVDEYSVTELDPGGGIGRAGLYHLNRWH